MNQSVNAYKNSCRRRSPVNLVTDKSATGRVYVSTYPTMMGLISESRDGKRRFGPGHFDFVVIDEAHRSVYRKYGAIFDYFDCLLVGLPPRRRTRLIAILIVFSTSSAVYQPMLMASTKLLKTASLFRRRAVSVPLRFQRDGIKYDDLPEEEKEAWDAADWDEDGSVPAAWKLRRSISGCSTRTRSTRLLSIS